MSRIIHAARQSRQAGQEVPRIFASSAGTHFPHDAKHLWLASSYLRRFWRIYSNPEENFDGVRCVRAAPLRPIDKHMSHSLFLNSNDVATQWIEL